MTELPALNRNKPCPLMAIGLLVVAVFMSAPLASYTFTGIFSAHHKVTSFPSTSKEMRLSMDVFSTFP